jgi:hypothetical protein
LNSLKIFLTIFLFSQISLAGNNKCPDRYIPPHTAEDIFQVKKWAAGGAFNEFANRAGYSFDKVAYKLDCPNWPLFGFSRMTGTACLEDDLSSSYISMVWAMSNLIMRENTPNAKVDKSFKEFYDEYAKKLGFDIYLTPLNEEYLVSENY